MNPFESLERHVQANLRERYGDVGDAMADVLAMKDPISPSFIGAFSVNGLATDDERLWLVHDMLLLAVTACAGTEDHPPHAECHPLVLSPFQVEGLIQHLNQLLACSRGEHAGNCCEIVTTDVSTE